MSGVIGRDRHPVEARSKVAGSCAYVANLSVPGMLWAKLVRSTCPHGRIVRIDTAAAREVPGVVGVFTAADLKRTGMHLKFGPAFRDQSVLADEKTIYAGEPVAAVVADRPRAAEDAAERVEVAYEELPAVFDPVEAARPGAPIIHERIEPSGTFADLRHFLPAERTNVCLHYKLRRGDVEAGLRAADLIVEGEYTTPAVAHTPMEPHVAVAWWEPDGRLVVWTANQSPSFIRSELAYLFGLAESQVRVQVPYLGGGFGGKLYVKIEAAVAACARLVGRPVKLALTMDETFLTLTKHPTRTRITSGVTRDGRILARRCEIYWDGGACSDIGPRIAQKSGFTAAGPYDIPNVWIDSHRVYTNKVPSGAFRGFGIPQLVWAYESHGDEVAAKLGLDPLEFRRRNVLREGDVQATGQRMEAAAFAACLEAVAERMEAWPEPASPPPSGMRRGRGLALGMKAVLTPSVSGAIVTLFADGSAAVYSSTVDMGQGSDTVLGMLAAEVLGLSPDRVRVVHPDTDVTPYDTITAASRSTYHMGNAVVEAAGGVLRQLREIAAPHFEVRPEDLDAGDGALAVRGAPGRRLAYPDVLALRFGAAVGSLTANGVCSPEYHPPDHETGQSDRVVAFWFAGATGVEVEVEEATGRVRLTRCAIACDAGRAIDPEAVRQQLIGGNVMQLGQTLSEAVQFDAGQVVNGNLAEYKLPTLLDLPGETEVAIVEVPQPDGPFGAKGVGESATFALSPAVGNAVAAATGARVRDLPLTPERVWRALQRPSGR